MFAELLAINKSDSGFSSYSYYCYYYYYYRGGVTNTNGETIPYDFGEENSQFVLRGGEKERKREEEINRS